jgi:hypothetical protein
VSKKEREEREMYSQSVNNMYRVQRYIRPWQIEVLSIINYTRSL